MLTSHEVRQKFIDFFKGRGHIERPSSSLVPEGDVSVLFTTAGMQQFKPYYLNPEMADKDFGSRNVVTVQKCVRTGDIDEVGDDTHLTFFEMLGNFSFGGYGRREAITYAYEFITKELSLPISYVTFYRGSEHVPHDEESQKIWSDLGVSDIREDGEDVFWGPTGDSGPCGPTTEIYCKNANGQDVEVWNIVFNEYFCNGSREQLDRGEATLTKLETLGIDTGMGFERLLATVQNKKSVYNTDVFHNEEIKGERIIADHIRTSMFMISDGVIPSNTGRGYVLRRLLRRAILQVYRLDQNFLKGLCFWAGVFDHVIEKYQAIYGLKKELIEDIFNDEDLKFRKTLSHGMKELENIAYKIENSVFTEEIKRKKLSGLEAFNLYQTYGFPIEITLEFCKEKNIEVDLEDFNNRLNAHVLLSQTSSAGMFKGGLANHNQKTVRLHTAHHLLLAALQQVVSPEIKQRGSNITEERLRMDFSFDRKVTPEELKVVEGLVNEKIQAKLPVVRREMSLADAEKIGAQMEFGAKYPETVSVYFIGGERSDLNDSGSQGPTLGIQGNPFSVEFCGGPHVTNTSELGHFKIQKEEASSAGVRRIKAVLG